MATEFWSTTMDQNSDAGFRAWGSELSARLAAAGLVKTSDTGQINWATATRAAANSNAGYEIWRFADTQQGTAPIFFRLDYGSGSSQNIPRIRLTVGTSTDGAGTITGTAGAVRTISASSGTTTGVSNFPSYLCVVDGYVGLAWKTSGSSSGQYAWAGFAICRSCDADGVPDARGALVLYHSNSGNPNSNSANQSFRYQATAAAYTQTAAVHTIFVPGAVTGSAVGSDFQMYLSWMINPQVLPAFGLAGAFVGELALGVTANVALVGPTPRTYIQLERQLGITATDSNLGLCMLWE